MSTPSYNEADAEERKHFTQCRACGEWLDMRSLDEVFSHETHQPQPDIQYSVSKRVTP